MHLSTVLKIHAAKTDRTEERNQEFNNDGWRHRILLSIIGGTPRQNIKLTEDLGNTANQPELHTTEQENIYSFQGDVEYSP